MWLGSPLHDRPEKLEAVRDLKSMKLCNTKMLGMLEPWDIWQGELHTRVELTQDKSEHRCEGLRQTLEGTFH